MSGDLSGFSMFDLFKSEAESHSAALNRDLVAIEGNPSDLSQVEPLMRAAHSIKGAARIVGLDLIVELAHAMEDCFVAVQKGTETLTSERVDQLLAGVDVMDELSKLDESELNPWLASQNDRCQQLTDSLRRPAPESESARDTSESPEQARATEQAEPGIAGPPDTDPEPDVEARTEPVEELTNESPSATPSASEPPSATESADAAVVEPTQTSRESSAQARSHAEPVTEQRTIPVNAVNLDRIMRLASESMVESRQLQSMQQSLVTLLKLQRSHADLLERLQRARTAEDSSTRVMDQLRELSNNSKEMLQIHSDQLERALWRSERTSTALYHQVIGSRMRPFAEGTVAFPRMIRDLAKSLGKQVSLEVLGGSVAVDRDILRKLERR